MVAEAKAERLEQFKTEEIAARDHTLERLKELGPESPVTVLREWWRNVEVEVEDWCRDYMRADQEELGLPASEQSWPDPVSIPSLWNYFSFRLARIYLTAGEGRRIDSSDVYDAEHYAAGSYFDLLVTDDGRFRQTCKLIRSLPFEMVTFEQFLAR
jgi:hypothetical protein